MEPEVFIKIKLGNNELEVKGDQTTVNAIIQQYLSKVLEAFPEISAQSGPFNGNRRVEAGRNNGERPSRRRGETKELLERLPALKGEGVFEAPRSLGEIQEQLKLKGWYHEQHMIQKAILRHPELGIKRIKENGKYKYVKV